ncbi:hypothetical protein F4861DRAFT_280483 [Xylaria intraflava]|nr:hypothetical protein F4861DRAFT_280483 [Xylaria intraflava]
MRMRRNTSLYQARVPRSATAPLFAGHGPHQPAPAQPDISINMAGIARRGTLHQIPSTQLLSQAVSASSTHSLQLITSETKPRPNISDTTVSILIFFPSQKAATMDQEQQQQQQQQSQIDKDSLQLTHQWLIGVIVIFVFFTLVLFTMMVFKNNQLRKLRQADIERNAARVQPVGADIPLEEILGGRYRPGRAPAPRPPSSRSGTMSYDSQFDPEDRPVRYAFTRLREKLRFKKKEEDDAPDPNPAPFTSDPFRQSTLREPQTVWVPVDAPELPRAVPEARLRVQSPRLPVHVQVSPTQTRVVHREAPDTHREVRSPRFPVRVQGTTPARARDVREERHVHFDVRDTPAHAPEIQEHVRFEVRDIPAQIPGVTGAPQAPSPQEYEAYMEDDEEGSDEHGASAEARDPFRDQDPPAPEELDPFSDQDPSPEDDGEQEVYPEGVSSEITREERAEAYFGYPGGSGGRETRAEGRVLVTPGGLAGYGDAQVGASGYDEVPLEQADGSEDQDDQDVSTEGREVETANGDVLTADREQAEGEIPPAKR